MPVKKSASKATGKPTPVAKKIEPKKTAAKKQGEKVVSKQELPAPKARKLTTKALKPIVQKATQHKVESSLMVQGAVFLKVPFFADVKKDSGSIEQKSEKPTVCSRPKINGVLDSKNLVELLSQQLEFENRTYFEGCGGQVCVKCNINNVDQKFYVDKSLGYCTDCAMLLGLGQSKEGVFSDAQMELMRRSMEKSIESAKDIDEDDIESALGEMDNLELEDALFAVEDDTAEFNA
jgi:hypothetical protein